MHAKRARVSAATCRGTARPAVCPALSRPAGFTLLEVLLALSILLVVLLSSIALAMQQPRVVRRLDAARQATRVLEWTAEEMRAQLIPLQATNDVGWNLTAMVVGGAPPDLKVAVQVAPGPGLNLYDVTLVARYTVYGQPRTQTLETLFWRPGGGP
jgi:prepilin-type N-terminal cleavage/methylation domain-containing protein